MCDQFTPAAAGEPPHGMMVAQVAAQIGFRGKVIAVSFDDDQDPRQQELQGRIGQAVQGWGEADSPAEIQRNLLQSFVATRMAALDTATRRLLALREAGARQCVLNLSVGSSAAMCAAAVLPMLSDPQAQAQLQRAFGEEWRSGLMQTAESSTHDDALVLARDQFAAAVHAFEEAGNSVVVAAGNDGNIPAKLGVPAGAAFTRSDLVTPDTTVVGALEGGAVASYTSDPSSVTLFVEGAARIPGLNDSVHGTSFAAPRVSAAMAQLHGQFPTLSSDEIEAKLRQPGPSA